MAIQYGVPSSPPLAFHIASHSAPTASASAAALSVSVPPGSGASRVGALSCFPCFGQSASCPTSGQRPACCCSFPCTASAATERLRGAGCLHVLLCEASQHVRQGAQSDSPSGGSNASAPQSSQTPGLPDPQVSSQTPQCNSPSR